MKESILDFANLVESEIKKRHEAEVDTTVVVIPKNNGVKKTGIILRGKGESIAPTIFMEEFYKDYMKGLEMKEIIEQVWGVYEAEKLDNTWIVQAFQDKEYIKKKVVYRLLNKKKNLELLEDTPYMDFLDLAIVPYVEIALNNHTKGAVKVSNEHLSMWEITHDEIFQWAGKNTCRILPPKIYTVEELLQQLFETSGDLYAGEVLDSMCQIGREERFPMYVLTNYEKRFGAACMVYEDVLEMFAQQLNSDIYIIPSSIHELILLPRSAGMDKEYIKDMVREVNATQVPKEEVLSDEVYLYSRTQQGFCIIN